MSFVKHLLSLSICLVLVHLVSSDPIGVRNREDDARAAVNNLIMYRQNLFSDFYSEASTRFRDFHLHFEQIHNQMITKLGDKIREINETRAKIIENVAATKINSSCLNFFDLQEFKDRVSNRTEMCYYHVLSTTNDLFKRKFEELGVMDTNLLECHERSLKECQSNAKDDGCYDFVIEEVKRANDTLVQDYQISRANFFNALLIYRQPCLGLIEYELGIDPVGHFQGVVDCVENELKQATPNTCPFM